MKGVGKIWVVFNSILRPKGRIIIAYSILSFLFLILYVWRYSFEFLIGVEFYTYLLFVFLLMGLVGAFFVDRRFKLNIKIYFIIALVQLLFISIVAEPIRRWQIDSSMEKAHRIISALDNYKNLHGAYPQNISELLRDIPKRTNLGTQYFYELDSTYDYTLKFQSYDGYIGIYLHKRNDWIFRD